MYFDFTPFGNNMHVSCLSDLLLQLDQQKCNGFAHLIAHAGRETIQGLVYLHSKGIAHRDLKPGNVLVSNQHYINLTETELSQQFMLKPIVCKLADFGESRSRFIQTQSLLASKTFTVDRGTVPYMAPETLVDDQLLDSASVHDLFLVDIWALGMIFFTLINPNLKYPWIKECRSAGCKSQEDFKKLLKSLLGKKELPSMDDKYEVERATEWYALEDIYLRCVTSEPASRLKLEEALEVVSSNILSSFEVTHLNFSQGTALQQIDQQIAVGISNNALSSEDQGHVESYLRKHDGTNACAFLTVQIADNIIAKGIQADNVSAHLGAFAEDIILNLPVKINKFRDRSRMYDPMEAYKLLAEHGLLSSAYDFSEELPYANTVFSLQGRQNLHKKLSKLSEKDFVAIYVSSPIVLTIGCHDHLPYIIDTHPVTLAPGNGGGLILIGKDNSPEVWMHLCVWLNQRLNHGGVKADRLQSLAIMTPQMT
ncbi:Serine/threonine-protein kinase BCK1/SLK1/SSP31 [Holothuria leucospilota]|uniref:Serine/threonine-protein kinase BCK1/SLK1/SSP31 n=1 Tax=Holothuria leucospilota TaxID=206669 RepID=A0A9Q0YAF4_HOLLE|nr:Serine/threonine-protein kinase BCK1/SLK1/SSP31 [Holothuria leucospilota]